MVVLFLVGFFDFILMFVSGVSVECWSIVLEVVGVILVFLRVFWLIVMFGMWRVLVVCLDESRLR